MQRHLNLVPRPANPFAVAVLSTAMHRGAHCTEGAEGGDRGMEGVEVVEEEVDGGEAVEANEEEDFVVVHACAEEGALGVPPCRNVIDAVGTVEGGGGGGVEDGQCGMLGEDFGGCAGGEGLIGQP